MLCAKAQVELLIVVIFGAIIGLFVSSIFNVRAWLAVVISIVIFVFIWVLSKPDSLQL